MKLSAAYISLAYRLQESVGDLTAADARQSITKLLMDEAGFPLIREAGARHSKSDSQLLQTIHDHAVGLGAACGMEEMSEAAATPAVPAVESKLVLAESGGGFLEEIPLREARTTYPIKLISPGTGSTAHYPAAVLKREAAKFKAGTLMFWNHPTAAEEAARPEGDLNNLAAITTSAGRWLEGAAAPKGDGIYSDAKVMSDYAERVEERAPNIGLSIRAGGIGTGKMIEGKPELKEFDYIESVDYVTKAGRGGLALAEAARGAGILPDGESMDETAIKNLVESAVRDAVAATLAATAGSVSLLEKRALKGDAHVEAAKMLETVSLPEAAKGKVISRLLEGEMPVKDGALDADKFKVLVEAAAKAEGAYVAQLTGSGRVFGMGTVAPSPVDPQEAERRQKFQEAEEAESIAIFEDIMGNKEAAKLAAIGEGFVKNQFYTGTPTSRRFILCPTTVLAGDPLLVGKVPCVALDDYQSETGGTTVLMDGSFTLTVIATTQVSPIIGSAVKPGDNIYAVGTLDSTTNVTTGLTLTKTPGDTFFGRYDPSAAGITSGTTDTAAVVLIGVGA